MALPEPVTGELFAMPSSGEIWNQFKLLEPLGQGEWVRYSSRKTPHSTARSLSSSCPIGSKKKREPAPAS